MGLGATSLLRKMGKSQTPLPSIPMDTFKDLLDHLTGVQRKKIKKRKDEREGEKVDGKEGGKKTAKRKHLQSYSDDSSEENQIKFVTSKRPGEPSTSFLSSSVRMYYKKA